MLGIFYPCPGKTAVGSGFVDGFIILQKFDWIAILIG
jgi:hypothetical protein